LTMPLSLGIYSLVEDNLANFVFGTPTLEQYCWVSVGFGAVFILISYLIDRQNLSQDYAFWSYLFGVMAFWGALTCLYETVYINSTPFKLTYLAINITMMALTVVLQRTVFAVFGACGTAYCVVDLVGNNLGVEGDSYASMIFGALVTYSAYYIQQKNANSNYPFWAYLAGVSVYWAGLSTLFDNVYDSSMFFKFIYLIVNVGLLTSTLFFHRNVFLFYGLLGISWYLEEIIYIYYWNSWYLPFILTGLGLALIAIAVYFGRQSAWKKILEQFRVNPMSEEEVPLNHL